MHGEDVEAQLDLDVPQRILQPSRAICRLRRCSPTCAVIEEAHPFPDSIEAQAIMAPTLPILLTNLLRLVLAKALEQLQPDGDDDTVWHTRQWCTYAMVCKE